MEYFPTCFRLLGVQADQLHRRCHLLFGDGTANLGQEPQVLESGIAGQESRLFDDDAHGGPCLPLAAGEKNFSLILVGQAADAFHQHRFAGAVPAHQAVNFPLFKGDGHVLQDRLLSVGFGQIADFNFVHILHRPISECVTWMSIRRHRRTIRQRRTPFNPTSILRA